MSRLNIFAFFDNRVRRIVREETASVRHAVEFNDSDALRNMQGRINELLRRQALIDRLFNGAPTEPAAVVSDLAAAAVRRERDRYESACLNLEHGEVDNVDVEAEVGAVEVLEGDRDAGRDGEGQKVSVFFLSEPNDVKLERGTTEAEEQGVEVEQASVVNVDRDVPVSEGSHVSPSSSPKVAESNSPG